MTLLLERRLHFLDGSLDRPMDALFTRRQVLLHEIAHTWWVINNSMLTSGTTNEVLKARAKSEVTWINKVVELSNDHFAVVEWSPIEVKGSVIESILN